MKTLAIPPDTNTSPQQQPRRGPTWARRVYVAFALLFWLGVIAQAFLAGAGIFVGGTWMTAHIALGHLMTSPLPLLPLLMLILSFVAGLPRADRWWSTLLLVLATLQPVVLYLRGALPLLSALHPVNALLLFGLPLYLLARVWRAMRADAV